MPDEVLLDKTYTDIAKNYSETISLLNLSDKWFFLRNMPRKRERILDIGCGTGNLLQIISKYFKDSAGVEPVPSFNSMAKIKSPKSTLYHASAEELPFPDKHFDYVISCNVFQHTNREKSVTEAVRVLKPEGKLVITEPILQPKNKLLNLYGLIYRIFWTFPQLLINYGISKSIKILKYPGSDEYHKLTNIHKRRRFDLDGFKDFYSKYLPGAKYKYLNIRVEGVVWQKK